MNKNTIESGKPLAVLSYFWIIGVIVAYFINKDKAKNDFAYFHIRQSLGIWLSFHAVGIFVTSIDSSLARLVYYMIFGFLLIYGFINAVFGNAQKIPVLGGLFQKWFANMKD